MPCLRWYGFPGGGAAGPGRTESLPSGLQGVPRQGSHNADLTETRNSPDAEVSDVGATVKRISARDRRRLAIRQHSLNLKWPRPTNAGCRWFRVRVTIGPCDAPLLPRLRVKRKDRCRLLDVGHRAQAARVWAQISGRRPIFALRRARNDSWRSPARSGELRQ